MGTLRSQSDILEGIEDQLHRIANIMSGESEALPALPADAWLSLKELTRYSGLSERTLQRAILDEDYPLPSKLLRSGGKRLVRWGDFGAWMDGCGMVAQPKQEARLGALVTDLRERRRGRG